MKNNIIKNKEAKSNLKYVFIGMILLLVIGVAIAQIGLFNINNLKLSEERSEADLASELANAEQTIPGSYDSRINVTDKNNIINNFKLGKISELYSEIERGELNPEDLVFLDEFGNEIEIEEITKENYVGRIYDVDVENDIVLVSRGDENKINQDVYYIVEFNNDESVENEAQISILNKIKHLKDEVIKLFIVGLNYLLDWR